MSWFGFGGSKDEDNSSSSSSYDSPSFDTSPSSSFPESSFDNSSSFPSSSSSSFAPSAGSGGVSDLQQELMQTQQQAMIKQVMFKLTENAFERCVSRPSSSLSSSESACIKSTVSKYLEASEVMMSKLSQQQ